MIDIQWIDVEGWCACRGKCSGNLGTYVSTLAHTCNDNLALALIHHVYSFLKVVIQIRYLVENGLRLVSKSLFAITANNLIIYIVIFIGHF